MKNNKILVVLVIILSLLVVGLTGYIVYDKILAENDKKIINNDNNQVNNNDKSNNTNNNTLVENNSSVTCNCENNNDVQVDYSKLADMGTGITIKSISGFNYQLSIDSKGELSYQNKENGTKGKINVTNVVDVEFQQYAGEENGEFFILTNEGQLYTITEKNMNSNNFEPIKDVVLGKVLKIGSFSTCKPNAGCGWGIYCVTADGITRQLVFSSV